MLQVLSLEHSKLVHCAEIKSEMDKCNKKIEALQEISHDLSNCAVEVDKSSKAKEQRKINQIVKRVGALRTSCQSKSINGWVGVKRCQSACLHQTRG